MTLIEKAISSFCESANFEQIQTAITGELSRIAAQADAAIEKIELPAEVRERFARDLQISVKTYHEAVRREEIPIATDLRWVN